MAALLPVTGFSNCLVTFFMSTASSITETSQLITSPVTAVAKYCDECICLFVRQDISGTARVIFTKFFVHVAYVRGSVLIRHVYDRLHHLSPGRDFLPR